MRRINAAYIKSVKEDGKIYTVVTDANYRKLKSKYKRGGLRTFCLYSNSYSKLLTNEGKDIITKEFICIDPRCLRKGLELSVDFSIYHEIGHMFMHENKVLLHNQYNSDTIYEELYCDMYALKKMGVTSKEDTEKIKNQLYQAAPEFNKSLKYRMRIWDKLLTKDLNNIMNMCERGIYNRRLYLYNFEHKCVWRNCVKGKEFVDKLLDKIDIEKWEDIY